MKIKIEINGNTEINKTEEIQTKIKQILNGYFQSYKFIWEENKELK